MVAAVAARVEERTRPRARREPGSAEKCPGSLAVAHEISSVRRRGAGTDGGAASHARRGQRAGSSTTQAGLPAPLVR